MAKPTGIALKDRIAIPKGQEDCEINNLAKISEVRLRDLIPTAEFIYNSTWSDCHQNGAKIMLCFFAVSAPS